MHSILLVLCRLFKRLFYSVGPLLLYMVSDYNEKTYHSICQLLHEPRVPRHLFLAHFRGNLGHINRDIAIGLCQAGLNVVAKLGHSMHNLISFGLLLALRFALERAHIHLPDHVFEAEEAYVRLSVYIFLLV